MQKNKILIEEREDGTLFGISRDGVDPYVKKLALTWEQTIAQLPFLKEITSIAEEQWKLSPKNPSYAPAPKPEGKKVEPSKKAVPPTKPEQPALTVEKPADEILQAPITSVAEPKTNEPSESVAEKKPVIPAPIASVAEAPPKQPTQPAQAPAPHRVSADAFQYRLAHPPQSAQPAFFATVQEALDALGVDKATRPTHNRYDRLSKKLQGEIIQEKKV